VQESCSHGSVGERGGNEPLYPEPIYKRFIGNSTVYVYIKWLKMGKVIYSPYEMKSDDNQKIYYKRTYSNTSYYFLLFITESLHNKSG